ncbi:Protein will die slowly [Gryllus bimaculatus]|nr:Protein will die slowly [Gryllus bimaculatus]
MGDRREVIVTSDTSGVLWTVCMWDSQTGTALMNYKGGGTTNMHCLSFVGNDYLLCAEKLKPLIHVWPLNSQEVSKSIERIVTPGCVSALCVSPTNEYCVIAISENIYIWDLLRGQLLHVTTRHFRAISCVKFTDDGSHFISGGQDGMVIVWPLAYLVSCNASELLPLMEAGQPEPRYTFSDHSLPVTDLYVGHGGCQALIASVSGDHTCKIYSISDGILLLSVVFNCALSAVTMSVNELEVFVGTVSGEIYSFDMQRMPRTQDYHVTKEEMSKKYIGHTKSVTSLSTSLDGFRLVSGSADEKVIIWDIKSKQCMKILQHKGPVSNALFALHANQISSSNFKPSTVIRSFKKGTEGTECIRYIRKDGFMEKEIQPTSIIKNMSEMVQADQSHFQDELEIDIIQLKEINNKLYKFAVNKLLTNT